MDEYTHMVYTTDENGIAAIALNRPPLNAFNRSMSGELIAALEQFANAKDERVLILTGEGRAFCTGEDLANINLDAGVAEMRRYAEEALSHYHRIVRTIMLTNKPILAGLNGVAAGAGMSIALACDGMFIKNLGDDTLFVPAFADMGLVPDSGMAATLPRLLGEKMARSMFETQGVKISRNLARHLNMADAASPFEIARLLTPMSPLALSLQKEIRNKALVRELDERVFPWELRAQANCLTSDYFKEKARAFLEKQNKRKESENGSET